MANKLVIKVTFKENDPFDSEVIDTLSKEKNKAGFVRKAVFCYLKGLRGNHSVHTEPDQQGAPASGANEGINKKLTKLVDL